MALTLATMAAVALYLVATAPFLPLLLIVHRLGGAYTAWFIAAIVLQLVPIGLVFLPLGFIGVLLLASTLLAVTRRLRDFRRSGIDNPEVHRRWIQEYLANLVALGFALEQKGAAFVFLEASSGQGLGHFWTVMLPLSVVMWGAIAALFRHEWRRLSVLPATEAA